MNGFEHNNGFNGTTVMRNQLIIVLLIVLVAVGLSGCGQKGPLTLPEDDDEKSKSTH
jgi:predicted small lipoprotein YifL